MFLIAAGATTGPTGSGEDNLDVVLPSPRSIVAVFAPSSASSRAPQRGQNAESSGTSAPQEEQSTRDYLIPVS
jgi:hypothetical protein